MGNLKALPALIMLNGDNLRDELRRAKELENILDMRVALDEAIKRVEAMLQSARMAAIEVEEYPDRT